MIRYVIAGRLARSARPGYAPGGDKLVDRAIVDAWIVDVRAQGVRSIICLLADEHLRLYVDLGTNLPSYYRRQGFTVAHIPAPDHRRPPLDAEALERIAQAYEALPEPVLVHCSAGIDRTGAAIAHLERRLASKRASSAFDRPPSARE
jgi:protein-tyrosine phosphatase